MLTVTVAPATITPRGSLPERSIVRPRSGPCACAPGAPTEELNCGLAGLPKSGARAKTSANLARPTEACPQLIGPLHANATDVESLLVCSETRTNLWMGSPPACKGVQVPDRCNPKCRGPGL